MLLFLYKNRLRRKIFGRIWIKDWLKRAYHLPALLAHTIRLSNLRRNGATIGVMSIVNFRPERSNCKNLVVGAYSYIAEDVRVGLHERVSIGSNVVINAGVRIYSASHDVNDASWPIIKKPIVIEDYAWIASEAILLPGVRIGRGAVVGAGAVVARDVPDHSIVTGNPAKVVRSRSAILNYSPTAFVSFFEAWIGTSYLPSAVNGHP